MFDQNSKLYLFNSDGNKLEEFQTLSPPHVRLYCCGPTVYNYAHIGNLRAYTIQDILRRVLLTLGYQVKHVRNITDVGHLTDDADAGEDKLVLTAREKGMGVKEIAEFFEAAFWQDCDKLNIARPEVSCRATEHIDDMIALIEKIEAEGFTYYQNGNLYFDTQKLEDYGRLVNLSAEDENMSRVGEDLSKKSQRDFVLWFSNGKYADQAMIWDSPWGRGYPGWHIECSAMSRSFLGEHMDIHCGGVDHKPIHHSNEIAQSECIIPTKPWVKYWLHNEFVILPAAKQGADAEKISKSKGNFLTISALEEQGFAPLDYRYFLLGTHYRAQVQFSFSALDAAKKARKKLQSRCLQIFNESARAELPLLEEIDSSSFGAGALESVHQSFTKALLNDLNTPQALAAIWALVKESSAAAQDKLDWLLFADSILQIGLFDLIGSNAQEESAGLNTQEPFKTLLAQRAEARKNKDFALADEIRAKIAEHGYQVVDTPEGSKLERI